MKTVGYTTSAPSRSEGRARVRRRLAEARQAVMRDPRCALSPPAHRGHLILARGMNGSGSKLRHLGRKKGSSQRGLDFHGINGDSYLPRAIGMHQG